MRPYLPNPNLYTWRISALVGIGLLALIGRQIPQPSTNKLVFALVFGVAAFFLIKRKIFDARVVFVLCGIGLAVVFNNFEGFNLSPKWEKWIASYITIMTAYGFAALIASGGFVKEFASLAAEFRFLKRPMVMLLATSCVTFVINAIILSAGSSCAVVAPIFVPLLIRLGFPAPLAAAAVVIGAWGGFINQADSGGGAISDAFQTNGLKMYSIAAMHIVPAIMALVAANFTFAAINRKEKRGGQGIESAIDLGTALPKASRLRIIVAMLPFLLLIPVEFVIWFLKWRDSIGVEYRLLICLVAATIASSFVIIHDSGQSRKKVLPVANVFFGGMWTGFAEVVLLIMAAKFFIAPFKEIFSNFGASTIAGAPMLSLVSVPIAFLASAMIGSGDAIVQAVVPLVVNLISLSPVELGAVASMVWLATEMGRNVSPISVATLTCARAVPEEMIDATTVARHALVPLVVGLVFGCLALYIVFKVVLLYAG